MTTAAEPVHQLVRGVRALARKVVGDDHYESYLRRHAAARPTEQPLSRTAYWRSVYDSMDDDLPVRMG